MRAHELDEIEAAHTLVGGTARGRRYTTQQLNRAYALLLASQFQGFCRDLHTEAVDRLVSIILQARLRIAMREELMWNRQLDRGNAHQTSIAGDFRRIGLIDFWARVDSEAGGNVQRRQVLDRMNEWRNAIAHQDFNSVAPGGSAILRLRTVREWRRSCRLLARSMDRIVGDHIHSVSGTVPW